MPAIAPLENVLPPDSPVAVGEEGSGVLVEPDAELAVRRTAAAVEEKSLLVAVLVAVALPIAGSLPPTVLHTIQMSVVPVALLV